MTQSQSFRFQSQAIKEPQFSRNYFQLLLSFSLHFSLSLSLFSLNCFGHAKSFFLSFAETSNERKSPFSDQTVEVVLSALEERLLRFEVIVMTSLTVFSPSVSRGCIPEKINTFCLLLELIVAGFYTM